MGPLSKKLDMKTLQGPKAKKYDSKTLNMGASKMDMKMMIDKGMVDGSLDSSGILGKKFADKKGKKSDKSKKGKGCVKYQSESRYSSVVIMICCSHVLLLALSERNVRQA